MRGSHVANWRRIVSLPTVRRNTCLLGPYAPDARFVNIVTPLHSNRNSCKDDHQGPDARMREKKPRRPKLQQAGKEGNHRRQRKFNVDPKNQESNALATGDHHAALSNHASKLGRRNIGDIVLGWTAPGCHPGSTLDHRSILGSALLSSQSTNQPSVESLLERDILNNVFNLPVPRLRVWLYNLDPGRLLQLTIRHVYGASLTPEKARLAESVIASRLEASDNPVSPKEAYLFLKLQRVMLSRNLLKQLRYPTYGRCIQVLDFKLRRMPVNNLVDICLTLCRLWDHLQKQGELYQIKRFHGKENEDLQPGTLLSPLIGSLYSSVLEIGPHSIPALAKLLYTIQGAIPQDRAAVLHEPCFLRIIELSTAMSLEQLLHTRRLMPEPLTLLVRHLEKLRSPLPLPLYFLCQEILGKVTDSIQCRDYFLVLRCLSRCDPLDATSTKRITLLYQSSRGTLGPSGATHLEPLLTAILLRTFNVLPVSREAHSELELLLSSQMPDAGIRPTASAPIPVPRGYFRKPASFQDIRPLLVRSLSHLVHSNDPRVSRILEPSHLRKHYSLPRSTQLALTTLLEEARQLRTRP